MQGTYRTTSRWPPPAAHCSAVRPCLSTTSSGCHSAAESTSLRRAARSPVRAMASADVASVADSRCRNANCLVALESSSPSSGCVRSHLSGDPLATSSCSMHCPGGRKVGVGERQMGVRNNRGQRAVRRHFLVTGGQEGDMQNGARRDGYWRVQY